MTACSSCVALEQRARAPHRGRSARPRTSVAGAIALKSAMSMIATMRWPASVDAPTTVSERDRLGGMALSGSPARRSSSKSRAR